MNKVTLQSIAERVLSNIDDNNYTIPKHESPTPLEALIHSQHAYCQNKRLLRQLPKACSQRVVTAIWSFYVPIELTPFGTTSLTDEHSIEAPLFTAYKEDEHGNGTAEEPVQQTIHVKGVHALFKLFQEMAVGRPNALHAVDDVTKPAIVFQNASRKFGDMILEDKRSLVTLMNEVSFVWSPMLCEVVVTAAGNDGIASTKPKVRGLRWWLFVNKRRHMNEDLDALTQIAQQRFLDDKTAFAQLCKPPSAKKKKARGGRGAAGANNDDNDDDDEHATPHMNLMHEWEAHVVNLLNRMNRAETCRDSYGAYNVAHCMSEYLHETDRVRLPDKFFGAKEQVFVGGFAADLDFLDSNYNDDLNPLIDEFEAALNLDDGDGGRGGGEESIEASQAASSYRNANKKNTFRETGYLPFVDWNSDDTHRGRPQQQQHNAEDPFDLANVYGIGAGFGAGVCCSVRWDQRTPLAYYDMDSTKIDDTLRQTDITKALTHESIGLMDCVTTRSTFGSLLTTLPKILQLDAPRLAARFTGFPDLDLVYLVMPSVMPWHMDMLLQPHLLKSLTLFREALPLIHDYATMIKDNVPERCAKIHDNATTKNSTSDARIWAATTMLGYHAESAMQHYGSLFTNGQKEMRELPTRIINENAPAQDNIGIVLDTNAMLTCLGTAQALLAERLAGSYFYLSLAHRYNASHRNYSREKRFISRILYEGHQVEYETLKEMNKAMDITSVAASMDYFIHLSLRFLDLQTRVKALTGDGSNVEQLRGRAHAMLLSGVRQMQFRAVQRVVDAPLSTAHKMSDSARACFTFLHDKSRVDRWFAVPLANYGNHDTPGALITYFATGAQAEGHIFYHIRQATFVALTALGSHYRPLGEIATGTMVNVKLDGTGGAGKSMIAGLLSNSSIPGTTSTIHRETAAAHSIQNNSEGKIAVFHEMPPELLGKGNDAKEADGINKWKALLEGGAFFSTKYDTSEAAKKMGHHGVTYVLNLVRGFYMILSNALAIQEQALNSRLTSLVITDVSGIDAPMGGGLQEYSAMFDSASYQGQTLSDYRLLQSKLCIMNRLQQAGALPPTEMTISLASMIHIGALMRKKGKRQNIRVMNTVRNVNRIITNACALASAEHPLVYRDLRKSGGNNRMKPFDLEETMQERVRRNDFFKKESLFLTYGMLAELFDDSVSTTFLYWCYKRGMPKGGKVEYYKRPNPAAQGGGGGGGGGGGRHRGGKGKPNPALPPPSAYENAALGDLTDYNYVVIHLQGRTVMDVITWIGQQIFDGNGTIGYAQLKPILMTFLNTYSRLETKKDKNNNDPSSDAPSSSVPANTDNDDVTEQNLRDVVHDVNEEERQEARRDNGDPQEDAPRRPPPPQQRPSVMINPLRYPVNQDDCDVVNGYLEQTPKGWILAIRESILSKYAATTTGDEQVEDSSKSYLYTRSTLFQALVDFTETRNLECYPEEALEVLIRANPKLLTARCQDPRNPNGPGVTLREYIENGVYKYQTGFTDITPTMNAICEKIRGSVDKEYGSFVKNPAALARWMAPTCKLKRKPHRPQVFVNMTAPSRNDIEFTGSTQVPQEDQVTVETLKYDTNWHSLLARCKRDGEDPYALENLLTIPTFERFWAQTMTENPEEPNLKSYPEDSVAPHLMGNFKTEFERARIDLAVARDKSNYYNQILQEPLDERGKPPAVNAEKLQEMIGKLQENQKKIAKLNIHAPVSEAPAVPPPPSTPPQEGGSSGGILYQNDDNGGGEDEEELPPARMDRKRSRDNMDTIDEECKVVESKRAKVQLPRTAVTVEEQDFNFDDQMLMAPTPFTITPKTTTTTTITKAAPKPRKQQLKKRNHRNDGGAEEGEEEDPSDLEDEGQGHKLDEEEENEVRSHDDEMEGDDEINDIIAPSYDEEDEALQELQAQIDDDSDMDV